MNNKYGPTKERLVATLPVALQRDPSVVALAGAVAEALAMRPMEIDRLCIYSQIDLLDEPLLDILARDFKVDWYDPNYSLEEKRRTVKSSWRVHKTLGTKAAVETAIRAIYPLTTVEEWFEYGGDPYHFRLKIDITSDSGDRKRQRRVLERLNFYKSLRSHNDGVRYFLMPEKAVAVAGGLFAGSRETVRASVSVPAHLLKKPGGGSTLTTGGGFMGSWQRVEAAAAAPQLTRPQGTGTRAAAAGFTGSVERGTVKLNSSKARAPVGQGGTGCTAGVFHTYQRMTVEVYGAPAQAQRSGLRGERTSNGLERMSGGQPDVAERSL